MIEREIQITRSMQLVMIPYLEDMMSMSTPNQWSHGQQLTLTKGHLVTAHLRPKTRRVIVKVKLGSIAKYK